MATIDQLQSALIKADAAGDTDAARAFASEIRKMRGGLDRAAIDADMQRLADPTAGMSGFDKFRAGAGKAFSDIGTGVSQMANPVMDFFSPRQLTLSDLVTGKKPISRVEQGRKDVAESRSRDAALMGTGSGVAGNIFGNVVAAVPTAFIPGANTIAGSAAIGAGMGLMQPSTSTSETLQNTGFGGVAGAVVPAAVRGYQVGKSFIEPFYESGRNQIMGRALRNAAGQQADEAMTAMRGARSLVPGSMPTAAEAANNPGIAALQRTATAIDPVAMNQTAARQAANNTARVEALEQLAGTAGERAALSELRAGTAEDMYRQAYGKAIDLTRDAVTGKFLSKAEQAGRKAEITKLMNTPALKEAAKKAQKMMLNDPNMKTKATSATGSVEGLDYMRRALGDMIKDAPPNEQRILIGLRDRLDTTLQSVSPKYLEAKNAFAQMSRPIAEMDVAQEIADKAVNRLNGNLQPAAFARALQDQTAATATGMKNATLQSTMRPESIATLNAIRDDLARQNFAQTAGRGVGSDTVQKLAFSNMMDKSGLPQFVRGLAPAGIVGNIAQRAGQVAYRDANERMAADLAQALLNPESAARLMESAAVNPRVAALVDALRRGGTALGASAPGLLQANQ